VKPTLKAFEKLADQLVEQMATRKVLNVAADDEHALVIASAMRARGFGAEVTTGLVRRKGASAFQEATMVRITKKRSRR
jgi:hypothetical protein